MNAKLISLSALVAVLLLSACSSTDMPKEEQQNTAIIIENTPDIVEQDEQDQVVETHPARETDEPAPQPLALPEKPDKHLLSKRHIYFDYDQSLIRSEFYPVLQAHAHHLVSYPQAQVLIEGHADERGSREYNIALGERRAAAVKRFFDAEGVNDAQMEIISYGEERPLDNAHNEEAWAKNRRAVLVTAY